MFARLNDASVDIAMDSAWQLSSLNATALWAAHPQVPRPARNSAWGASFPAAIRMR